MMESEKFWVHVSCRSCDWQVLRPLGAVEEHCPRCRGTPLDSSLISETAARKVRGRQGREKADLRK